MSAALVQRELTSHQASLRMELAPALPMIQGDRVQLQQVIINLVMNGAEAMQSVTDRPRELVIRSRQDETQQVLVSVTDCGVGIPTENADRLFNPFFTTKSSGMGMGLSICRSIMEAHDGRLWATAKRSLLVRCSISTLPPRCCAHMQAYLTRGIAGSQRAFRNHRFLGYVRHFFPKNDRLAANPAVVTAPTSVPASPGTSLRRPDSSLILQQVWSVNPGRQESRLEQNPAPRTLQIMGASFDSSTLRRSRPIWTSTRFVSGTNL